MIQQQKKKKKKKKSIAISKSKANLFNQIIISNGEDATQKFTQISKGQSVVEPSNDNTDQMDVDRATAIHFQENILMDILSYLPVRSLLRFKCASKLWETLISEPYFKMKHLNHAKNNQDSLKLLISQICRKDGIFSMYSYPLLSIQLVENVQKLDCPSNPTPLQCKIHCCYDGLVVIEAPDDLYADEHSTLLLWNPSTRESIVLPAPEFPQKRTSCFGLGYDSTSGEYKILHIHQDTSGCKLPNEILVLKDGSWRRFDKHPRGIYSLLFEIRFLAFVHAAFHWIGISGNCFMVVSFSISNEVYGEIPLPEKMLSFTGTIGISVLEGMLCVYTNSLCRRKDTIHLWVLKEYGVEDSWVPLLSIEDPSVVIAVPRCRFADGEVLFWCGLCSRSAFGTCSGPFGSWPRCVAILDGHPFTESLISPKSLISLSLTYLAGRTGGHQINTGRCLGEVFLCTSCGVLGLKEIRDVLMEKSNMYIFC